MTPRSWLFVPADDERKVAKAVASDADAVIFDLEDSVVPERKKAARAILKDLPKHSNGPQWWVRVNRLGSEFHKDDLRLIRSAYVHGIVLPKTEGGSDVMELSHRTGTIPIHAIVTETPASLFNLMSYAEPGLPLVAMLAFTYKLARSLCLAGAVAAGVQPVDGVFADFRDEEGLRQEAEAASREGFTGKLAIHPAQVAIINSAFTPSADDIRYAAEIVAAFEAQPNAGVLSVGGRMVDRPHLVQARKVLERAR
jgi:citrate lyase subunit beta/citryl-CoA lyase